MAGSITVCATGECDWPTISSAVNSISNTSTDPTTIFVYNGTYTEQVYLPPKAAKVTIYGQTADITSYHGNTVTLQYNSSLAVAPNDEWTAPLINESPNTAVYNLDIRNLWGEGYQAIALSAYNTSQGYYGLGIYGSQDTLLAEVGNQFYANSYIEGMTDFIFGEHARAWITNSTVASNGYGWVTASGRVDDDDPSWYVITDSVVTAAEGAEVEDGSVFLGRPWRNYARVTFQRCEMGSHINETGWSEWTEDEPQTDHVTFEEWDNSGAGSDTSDRAGYSTVRNSPLPIEFILGADYKDWVDKLYLPSE
ncbi:putative carbohydrate esterase family 8 protein [Diaporthe ampelina]|uniref:pectinesterase n=1 Tax=Diaporthe ampelina TaxID=1214573 RepID=A0A0G2FV61_9PEZI|nr:putative carbohydrate esterase family 8 protein [Diaporthe ampelina]